MMLFGLNELKAPGMIIGIVLLAVLYIAILILYVLIRSKEHDDEDRKSNEKQ